MPAPGASPSDQITVAIASAQTSIDDGDAELAAGQFVEAQAAYQAAGAQLAPLSVNVAATAFALSTLPAPIGLGDAMKAQAMAKWMLSQVQADHPPPTPPGAGLRWVGIGALALVVGAAGYFMWRGRGR